MAKNVLGRGLGALIPRDPPPAARTAARSRSGHGRSPYPRRARSSGRSRSTKSAAARTSRGGISSRNRCRNWSIRSANRASSSRSSSARSASHYELIAGRTPLARGQDARPQGGARHRARGERPGGAGTGADRKSPARRPQRGRGSAAPTRGWRPNSTSAGGHRAQGRQEPRVRGERDAPARPGAAGAGLADRRNA